MQIVEENLRGDEGEIKLIPETIEDLWHLRFLIEKGDKVFSLTKRAIQSEDKLRSDKEMVFVRIGVEVEKVEFHKFANRLRIAGKIFSGIEASGFHTLNITTGKELSIIKKWKKEQLERLKKVVESSKRPEVVILTIEEGEAVAGILREWGVEEVFEERKSYSKDHGGVREEFFSDILEKLKNLEFRFLIIAGPGFAKKDFYEFLVKKIPEIAEKAIIVDTASIGRRGFVEVVKRRAIDRLVGELRLAEEAEIVDKLLEKLAKGEKVVYGTEDVKIAGNYGAIETLLISDDYLLREREKWDVDNFMESVRTMGGKVVILSSEFEPGEIVSKLGGICAILRFEIK
ncbi:MAG: mRNA surveillance protein pelota [Archaeoglobaceae archaeon]